VSMGDTVGNVRDERATVGMRDEGFGNEAAHAFVNQMQRITQTTVVRECQPNGSVGKHRVGGVADAGGAKGHFAKGIQIVDRATSDTTVQWSVRDAGQAFDGHESGSHIESHLGMHDTDKSMTPNHIESQIGHTMSGAGRGVAIVCDQTAGGGSGSRDDNSMDRVGRRGGRRTGGGGAGAALGGGRAVLGVAWANGRAMQPRHRGGGGP